MNSQQIAPFLPWVGLIIAVAMLVYLHGAGNLIRRVRRLLPGAPVDEDGWQIVR